MTDAQYKATEFYYNLEFCGNIYGRLTILSEAVIKKEGGKSFIVWKCLCACGKETIKRKGNITGPSTTKVYTKSCGCFFREEMEKRKANSDKEKNRLNKNARRRKFYQRHAERLRLKEKEDRIENPEKHRENDKKKYEKNRERIINRHREYNALHPGKVLERDRKYRATHPGYIALKGQRRRARENGAPGNGVSKDDWEFIKEKFKQRCSYCWRKCKALCMDHIIPLVHGGAHDKTNIVPACRSCNSKKFTGPPLQPVQPILPLGF